MTQSKTIKRLLTAAVSAVMSFSALPLNAAGAEDENIILTYDDFEISYAVTNEWLGGQNVLITVTNLSDESICNWAFRYDAGGNIENLYNAEIFDNDGTEYIIKNEGWNFELAPKHSVSFGYSMYGDDFAVPSDFALCSERVDVTEGYDVEIDYTDTWYNGVRGEIAVTNTSEEPLEAWTLEFDTNFKIDYVWNGKITDEEGNHYAVASEAWTQYLAPGETKSVGFVGSFEPETEPVFSSYELSAVKIKGLEHSETTETEQENENTDPTEVPEIDSTPELNAEDIDMTTDVIDLGYIENLIDANLITVNCNENSQIRAIDGKLTEKPLNSAEDAANILNCASALFGDKFCADEADIEVQTNGDEVFYRYSAHIDGVLVQGSQIILSAKDGEVTGMFNTYDNSAEIVNTQPSISSEEAIDISFDNFFANCSSTIDEVISDSGLSEEEVIKLLRSSFDVSSELMLTQSDNELVWDITIVNRNELTSDTEVDYSDVNDYAKYIFSFCSREYYIYADGEDVSNIFIESDNRNNAWNPVPSHGKDLFDDDQNFTAEAGSNTDNGYRMRDPIRKIETYKTTNITPWGEYDMVSGEMYHSETNDFSAHQKAVSVHVNMSKVYDYYNTVLGRDSYDGNHSLIQIYTDTNNDYTCWDYALKKFLFGNHEYGHTSETALDIVAHEYTHAVSRSIARLGGKDENGALNEAYSDILGALIEAEIKGYSKTSPSFATIGEDRGERHTNKYNDSVIRNIGAPKLINLYIKTDGGNAENTHYPKNADHYSDMDNPIFSKVLDNLNNKDKGGVHVFSTIFSHAAYLMITDSNTVSISKETWAKVFYNSLYRLSSGATFQDARYAVIITAQSFGFKDAEIQAIKTAFDKVGITDPQFIRIVLKWGISPQDLDAHLTGPGITGTGRFHIFYQLKEYYEDGTYYNSGKNYAAELDRDDTTSYGPEVTTIHKLTPGDYYFFVHDYTNLSETNSTEMSLSGVTVSIYYGSSNLLRKQVDGRDAVFRIPEETVATLWEVCKITIDKNGNVSITKISNYSNEEEPLNVGQSS